MGLNDMDAHALTKFEHELLSWVYQTDGDANLRHFTLAAMTGQAKFTKAEKNLLRKELTILRKQLKPLQ